jgi:hypothetical protein
MPALVDLCIVVPCGPGECGWQALLPQLAMLPAASEVILSGVENSPGWPPPVSAPGAPPTCRVLSGPAGRAAQQNRGAAAGRNRWLWFLHADSRLHPHSFGRIVALPEGDAVAYFDLAFHDGGAAMQLNRCGAYIRSRWLGMPFGDQGLLLPRALFERLGGFDERVGSGEDHALVWAARRAGVPLRALGLPLYTSARRYAEHGWLATTARHLRLTWQQARRFSRGAA